MSLSDTNWQKPQSLLVISVGFLQNRQWCSIILAGALVVIPQWPEVATRLGLGSWYEGGATHVPFCCLCSPWLPKHQDHTQGTWRLHDNAKYCFLGDSKSEARCWLPLLSRPPFCTSSVQIHPPETEAGQISHLKLTDATDSSDQLTNGTSTRKTMTKHSAFCRKSGELPHTPTSTISELSGGAAGWPCGTTWESLKETSAGWPLHYQPIPPFPFKTHTRYAGSS